MKTAILFYCMTLLVSVYCQDSSSEVRKPDAIYNLTCPPNEILIGFKSKKAFFHGDTTPICHNRRAVVCEGEPVDAYMEDSKRQVYCEEDGPSILQSLVVEAYGGIPVITSAKCCDLSDDLEPGWDHTYESEPMQGLVDCEKTVAKALKRVQFEYYGPPQDSSRAEYDCVRVQGRGA